MSCMSNSKFSGLWNICHGIFNLLFVWCRFKDSALWWKIIVGKFITNVSRVTHKVYSNYWNNVVKCKSKSISLDLYCSRQPWFSKDATVKNKWPNAARVKNGFIECLNVSLERSLRMKVLIGTAWVFHLT